MERLTYTEPNRYGAEAPTPQTLVGTWPDLAAFGRSLAEDLGMIDYIWQVPQVIRPYVQLDYEAIAGDICRAGGMAIVELEDGIRVYERRRA